jgi:GWxTD domain-containing protein
MRSRFARVLRFVPILAIAAAVCAVPWAATSAPPLKAWRDGAVRLLLSDDEYEKFGTLRTDDERRAFVDAFWNDIDAAPDTAGRNFRATFEERCAIADQRYTSIHDPGWRTVRGRVYILLGEPNAVRHESGGLKAVDKEVWVYGGAAEPQGGLEVAFYRCLDGSYRIDPACQVVPDTDSVAFDWDRMNYLRTLRDSNPDLSLPRIKQMLVELLSALPRSVPSSSLTTRSAQATAPPKEAEGGALEGGGLEAAPYYFRAQDGSVLVFVTLEIPDEHQPEAPAAAPSRYLAAPSFERVDKRGARVTGSAIHTTALDPVERTGHPPTFFGRAYLEPGKTYAARYALRDEARGELYVKDARLTVPELGPGLSASSLVLAERFGPAGGTSGPYRVGSEEVVPRVGASFRRSELLRLYLQVYGAAIDASRSTARVDVLFHFERVVNGKPKKFGKPFSVREAAGAAMGLALPIGDWPPGAYRVRVDLHDRVAGERVGVEGAFTIVDD